MAEGQKRGISIYWPWIADIALRWAHVGSPLRLEVFSDCIRPIRFIAENIAPLDINLAEQRNGVLGIMVIAGTEQKASGLPKLSAKIWIFAFLPPLETSTTLFFVFSTIGTLMHLVGSYILSAVEETRKALRYGRLLDLNEPPDRSENRL